MSPDHDRPRDAVGRFVAVEGTAWVRRWDGRWRECVALFGDDDERPSTSPIHRRPAELL